MNQFPIGWFLDQNSQSIKLLGMNEFSQIVSLIQSARSLALYTVNSELVNLYWQVGHFVSEKLGNASWGESTVVELTNFIKNRYPDIKGFDKKNIYRMCQFYQLYKDAPNVAPVVRHLQDADSQYHVNVAPVVRHLHEEEIPTIESDDIRKTILAKISWTHHLIIIGRCKSAEEREFYIRLCIQDRYSKRELDRQINSGVFERVMLGNAHLSKNIKQLPQDFSNVFKDSYVFEFLNLPEPYIENELRKALLHELKHFLLELGSDYLLVGEEFPIKVGNRDFRIDLLFFHRSLQCLIAFELKTSRFEPEYLGKTNFYLEALDRDIKKPHENPTIGILLCRDKDDEVVEYALNRSLSPTMVAQYLMAIPDKKILAQKLHELFLAHE
jgi:predicted nuclease of restriction endonuclease-like (RecB) superfamily